MKTNLLSFLLLVLTIVACKKDEETTPVKTTAELVQGTWNISSDTYEYFDAANKKIYEEPNTPTVGTFTLTAQAVNVSYADGTTAVVMRLPLMNGCGGSA